MSDKLSADDYIPYGEEWEKEVSKYPKKFLVQWLKKVLQEKQSASLTDSEIEKKAEYAYALHEARCGSVFRPKECKEHARFDFMEGYKSAVSAPQLPLEKEESNKVATIKEWSGNNYIVNNLDGDLLFTGTSYDECYEWCCDNEYDLQVYRPTIIKTKKQVYMEQKKKKKLTNNQIYVIQVLKKYDCVIMHDNWVTGGHGIRLDGRSIESLKNMGIIANGKLTEKGKSIPV